MLNRILLLAALIILTVFTLKIAPVSSQSKPEFVPDEVLVKFAEGVDRAQQKNIHAKVGGVVKSEISQSGVQVVRIPPGQVRQKAAAYKINPQVLYAEPNFTVEALELPDDPLFGNQWHYHNTGQSDGLPDADIDWVEAWQNIRLSGFSAVEIAILDTGIDQDHEDLAAKIAGNINFTNSNTVDDKYGHGTHTAGIAAAITGNARGIVGTGFSDVIKLLNVKVLDDNASGSHASIANGIYWATDHGAEVISMSLGGDASSTTLQNAVSYAHNKGVVLVAAAGNSNDDSLTHPAAYDNVIAVAATTHNDKRASFSSYGNWVQVAAPGENILSTFPNHDFSLGRGRWGRPKNYGPGNGTSMSTPMVAGLAALIISKDGAASQQVWTTIAQSSDPIYDNCGGVSCWQWGRINACNALGGSCTYDNSQPTPTFTPVPTANLIPTPTTEPTPTQAPAEGFILNTTGYKIKGVQHADLIWSGTTVTSVDVYRNDINITTTANDGIFTDNIGNRGNGAYVYKVCESGTLICTNESTVSFN